MSVNKDLILLANHLPNTFKMSNLRLTGFSAFFFIIGLSLLSACNTTTTSEQHSDVGDPPAAVENTQDANHGFDAAAYPVSDADLGEFPYFGLPDGAKYPNRPLLRDYDEVFFPIDGKMQLLEGRVFKSYVHRDRDSGKEWSLPFFLKSYDDIITSVGGVKIFDDAISREERDRLQKEAAYLGEEGSIDYSDKVRTYLIRRPDGDDIYIQLGGNTASGAIQILQKAPFKQTIQLLKADAISKELTEKGKAVLYINFDLDKASLKSDGKQAVDEIAKVLASTTDLKLSVEGHTDNSGSADHNTKLSKERAETVVNALIASGISKDRLKAEGYGAEKPLVANDTEDNKAKNRRVELIKI